MYLETLVNKKFKTYSKAALERNLPFLLTLEQFEKIVVTPCSYCGKQATEEKLNGIDRINNAIGYQLDNCTPCCGQCNLAKRGYSPQEFTYWIQRAALFQRQYTSQNAHIEEIESFEGESFYDLLDSYAVKILRNYISQGFSKRQIREKLKLTSRQLRYQLNRLGLKTY